ncbi:MAG: SHOCT domain-containing protein [Firmicutes bacterium]|nr:SHOCT domain-containing protein [Bacillota bacterium]
MRTLQEMKQYAEANGFKGTQGDFLCGFGPIEKFLQPDEKVKFCFIGGLMGNIHGFAVTDTRLIYGSNMVSGPNRTRSIALGDIKEITKNGVVVRLATGGTKVDFVPRPSNIDVVFELQKFMGAPKQAGTVVHQNLTAEELKKFYELMCAGIITPEEFEQKKKQFLK